MPAHTARLRQLRRHLRGGPTPPHSDLVGVRSVNTADAEVQPRFFDYPTITSNIHVRDAIPAVEACFASLAAGEVDVPFPMHIAIAETPTAGPGDAHVKGGYIAGEATFTVKLATVSFVKNVDKGLPCAPPSPPPSGAAGG